MVNSIADVLITGGWQQGAYGAITTKETPHCLVGAARCAAYGAYRDTQFYVYIARSYAKARELLHAELLHEGVVVGIECWNDDPNRTFDEVLALAKQLDEVLAEEEQ